MSVCEVEPSRNYGACGYYCFPNSPKLYDLTKLHNGTLTKILKELTSDSRTVSNQIKIGEVKDEQTRRKEPIK